MLSQGLESTSAIKPSLFGLPVSAAATSGCRILEDVTGDLRARL